MATPTPDQLRAALRSIRLPTVLGGNMDAVIDSLQAHDGLVHVALRTDRAHAAAMETVRAEAQALLARQPGVTNATVVLTAHRAEAAPRAGAATRPHSHGPGAAPATAGPASTERPNLMPGVRHVVAVASGKGGVGKSTTAVNLAVSLLAQGHRVGLLDADIYGPSLPRMMGVDRKPETRGSRMIPLQAWGMPVMSIGFLVDKDTAMIWRGPMVMGALEQMMGQVEWGELDILVVDMPPGTGDAQLTMAQRVSLSGAVIVSTPQDIALIDARRGVRMFEKTMVPVLGIIENMSTFCCPNCGHETNLFGHGGAKREAEALGVPFLGEVPLLLEIRTTADAGTPISASAPGSAAALAYGAIARRVAESLGGAKVAAPRIVAD